MFATLTTSKLELQQILLALYTSPADFNASGHAGFRQASLSCFLSLVSSRKVLSCYRDNSISSLCSGRSQSCALLPTEHHQHDLPFMSIHTSGCVAAAVDSTNLPMLPASPSTQKLPGISTIRLSSLVMLCMALFDSCTSATCQAAVRLLPLVTCFKALAHSHFSCLQSNSQAVADCHPCRIQLYLRVARQPAARLQMEREEKRQKQSFLLKLFT